MPRGFEQMYALRVFLLVLGVSFIVAVPPIGVIAFGVWLAMHKKERGRRRFAQAQADQAAARAQELADAHWILWRGRS